MPFGGVETAAANDRKYFCLLVVTELAEERKTEPEQDEEANCGATGLVLISGEDQNTYRRIGCWQFGDRIKSFSPARYSRSEAEDTHLQQNAEETSHGNRSGTGKQSQMQACYLENENSELVITTKRRVVIRRSLEEKFRGCAEQVITIY